MCRPDVMISYNCKGLSDTSVFDCTFALHQACCQCYHYYATSGCNTGAHSTCNSKRTHTSYRKPSHRFKLCHLPTPTSTLDACSGLGQAVMCRMEQMQHFVSWHKVHLHSSKQYSKYIYIHQKQYSKYIYSFSSKTIFKIHSLLSVFLYTFTYWFMTSAG